MATSLAEFIGTHRTEILDRCAAKYVSAGMGPVRLSRERGIPLFLDQIVNELDGLKSDINASALQHGRDLFSDGFTVTQLVHDYGGVCQSITDLAVEADTNISVDGFRTLNRCLDDAIAYAASSFTSQERSANDGDALRLRDLVYTILTGFEALREGQLGISGATGDLVHRSLLTLRDLADRGPR
jgi:hypothetical protein